MQTYEIATSLAIFVITVYLKDSWKLPPGIKELLAKHYVYMTCAHAYLLSQPETYKPRSTDVYVDTFGRSGTMNTVNIIHQLRTGGTDRLRQIGDMGCFYVPITGSRQEEMSKKQLGRFRLFWTHGLVSQVPEDVRYVVVMRNPIESAWSWFHFARQFFAINGSLSFEDFYWHCFVYNCHWPDEAYWIHSYQWWVKSLNSPTTLWLHYESLTSTNNTIRENVIKKIADFLKIRYKQKTIDTALHRSSRDFFLNNRRVFAHRWSQHRAVTIFHRCNRVPQIRIDKTGEVKAVLHAAVDSDKGQQWTKRIPMSIVNDIAAKWDSMMKSVTGADSYEAFMQPENAVVT